jgi:hypothetical protein
MARAGKAAAQTEADRAISTATGAVNIFRSKLKAAESSRASARVLTPARRALADADAHVQKARTAYEQEDYASATAAATAITEPIAAASKELDAATTAPARRRR